MQTRFYSERSNARRAAKAAGVDPNLVTETEDGFTFPAPSEDSLEIPEFLKVSEDQLRAAAAKRPIASAPPPEPKPEPPAPAKVSRSKKTSEPRADKTGLLIDMLEGKGATVEALTKATGWLPHTLRARLSGLAKPNSKGSEGLKIERERVDGVTTYRVAS